MQEDPRAGEIPGQGGATAARPTTVRGVAPGLARGGGVQAP